MFKNSWLIYYLAINNTTTPSTQGSDVKKPKLIELSKNINMTSLSLIILWLLVFNFVFISCNNTEIVFFDMVYFSNNNVAYFFILILILLFTLLSSRSLANQNISFSHEYLIFVVFIIIFGHLLISSTNLFFTILLLELVALLIFGKMAVSRILVKKSALEVNQSFNKQMYSWGLFNSLFFQFWANFISSICLFFSLINIHYIIGNSNFFVVNYIFSIITATAYLSHIFISFILVFLVTGFFIKLGLSPYQFFKIETYKGIPLYIIIIYSTLYLSIYIYVFVYFFLYLFSVLREFTGLYVLFILILSLVYLVSLLFDTKNFKAFLSYSTLITISNVFVLLLIL